MNSFFLFTSFTIQKLLWPILRSTFVICGDLKIEGLENIINLKKEKPIVFASNHLSELDVLLIPASLPFFSHYSPLFCATREKSFYNESGFRQVFYGGFLFRLIGGVQVYGGLKDYEKSLKDHINLLKQGYTDLVFPEGGITKTGELSEAKGGIAYLAEKTNSIIIPIAISGLYKITLFELFSRKRKIRITFGKFITQHELKNNVRSDANHYKAEAGYVMTKIAQLMI